MVNLAKKTIMTKSEPYIKSSSFTKCMPVLHLLHRTAEGCIPVTEGLPSREHVGPQDKLADQLIWNTATH